MQGAGKVDAGPENARPAGRRGLPCATGAPRRRGRPARGSGPGILRAWVAVGPEGDWAPEELDAMRGTGFEGVTLGPNVMRSETAAVASVVLMRAALDAA